MLLSQENAAVVWKPCWCLSCHMPGHQKGLIQGLFPPGHTGQPQGGGAEGDPFDLLFFLPLYLIIASGDRGGRILFLGT